MTGSPNSKKSFHIIVSGRVQGVGYRYSAVRAAAKHRIAGWVRNNVDGSVELDCEGDAKDMNDFIAWLKAGPSGARVTSVEINEKQYQGFYSRFVVEY
ncbi:MAG: acylphosphatase [Spirochaetaceae bacterium]|nr:acylphosphatase [Spirochaetaceae bacterium]